MMRNSKENNEIEVIKLSKNKKYVRLAEGAELYSMSLHTFRELVKDARAVIHLRRMVLVDTEILDDYIDSFRDEF